MGQQYSKSFPAKRPVFSKLKDKSRYEKEISIIDSDVFQSFPITDSNNILDYFSLNANSIFTMMMIPILSLKVLKWIFLSFRSFRTKLWKINKKRKGEIVFIKSTWFTLLFKMDSSYKAEMKERTMIKVSN